MKLQRIQTTLRRRYEPMVVSAHIRVDSSVSTLAQVFDAESSTYSPSWEVNGLALGVAINAYVDDGSMESPLTAANLDAANMVWRINGKRYGTDSSKSSGNVNELDSSWSNKISTIDATDSDKRGQIKIYRNSPVGETLEIVFEGNLYDKRTGNTIAIKTLPMQIASVAKAESQYTLAMADIDVYAPFKDKQNEKEMCEAMGWTSQWADDTTLTERDGYLRTYPITLTKGGNAVTDYTLELSKKGDDTDTTECEITNNALTIDLRLVEQATYTVTAKVDGKAVATATLSIMRRYGTYQARPSRNATLRPSDRVARNMADVQIDGQSIKNPEAYLYLVWESGVDNKVTRWQTGRACTINVAEAGMADSMNVSLLTAPIGRYAILSDDNGNAITNEEGDIIIVPEIPTE